MFKSKTEITFSGLNAERTFNALVKNGVTLYKTTRSGKECTVTVPYSKRRVVLDFLKEKCYTVTKCKDVGPAALLNVAVKHIAVSVAAILLIPLLLLSSNICLEIKISGDYAEETVSRELLSCGISVGTSFKSLNVDSLENSLALKLDAMYSIVERRGSTLYVNVIKRVKADEPIDMNKRHDIVSDRDGVVTRILTAQGTAEVKVGDRVKKGQTLIAGKRTFNDGTNVDVYALGEITLMAEVSYFERFTGTETVTELTGNVFTRVVVRIAEAETSAKSIPFESYDVSEKEFILYPFNVKVVKQTCYEKKTVERSVTFEQNLDKMKLEAYAKALLKVDFAVSGCEYAVRSDGVTATLTGLATVGGN